MGFGLDIKLMGFRIDPAEAETFLLKSGLPLAAPTSSGCRPDQGISRSMMEGFRVE